MQRRKHSRTLDLGANKKDKNNLAAIFPPAFHIKWEILNRNSFSSKYVHVISTMQATNQFLQ